MDSLPFVTRNGTTLLVGFQSFGLFKPALEHLCNALSAQWLLCACAYTSAGAMLIQLHGTSHADHMGMLLQVDGSPFHFAGFNNYYMPTYAADPNLNERTKDVDVVFQ